MDIVAQPAPAEIQRQHKNTIKEIQQCLFANGNDSKWLFSLPIFLNKFPIVDIENKMATFNRAINYDRCEEIYQSQVNAFRKNGYFNLFSIHDIVIGKSREDKEYSVIDGQHRLVVAKEIMKNFPEEANNIIITVTVIKTQTTNELEQRFKEINSNIASVPQLYLLSNDDIKEKTEEIVDRLMASVKARYNSAYFSKASRPQRPNLSLPRIADALKNHETFINWVEEKLRNGMLVDDILNIVIHQLGKYNNFLKVQDANYFIMKQPASKSAITKKLWERANSRSPRLILGMFPNNSWINIFVINYLVGC